jgi:hypothetical protein
MYWTDLELNCVPTDDALRSALAASFGMSPAAIQIVSDMDHAAPVDDQTVGVVVLPYRMPGDFPLHVELFLRERGLARKVGHDAGSPQSADMIRAIAVNLACAVVTSGPELDPWEWLLYTRDGRIDRIHADPDDEHGSCSIGRRGSVCARLRQRPRLDPVPVD